MNIKFAILWFGVNFTENLKCDIRLIFLAECGAIVHVHIHNILQWHSLRTGQVSSGLPAYL